MSEDTETPSAAPTSTAQALPAAQAQGIDQAFVQQALQANIDALDDPTASVDMSTVLTGTALEELDSQRMEWENNGWHQDGTVTVLSAELQPSADPSEAVVKACVDSSDLRLLDENNNEVNGDVPANEQRSLMLITFRNEDGTWKLADRQFPDDPHC